MPTTNVSVIKMPVVISFLSTPAPLPPTTQPPNVSARIMAVPFKIMDIVLIYPLKANVLNVDKPANVKVSKPAPETLVFVMTTNVMII